MRSPETDELDRKMMIRCIALSVLSGEKGVYPYGAVIRRASEIVSESINRVANEGDVTRYAEVVVISGAQKALGTVNLEDCVIYASAEPCAYCSYAIRESITSLGPAVVALVPHSALKEAIDKSTFEWEQAIQQSSNKEQCRMPRITCRSWTAEQIKLLRALADGGASPARASVVLKRSRLAVQSKARELGAPFGDFRQVRAARLARKASDRKAIE